MGGGERRQAGYEEPCRIDTQVDKGHAGGEGGGWWEGGGEEWGERAAAALWRRTVQEEGWGWGGSSNWHSLAVPGSHLPN